MDWFYRFPHLSDETLAAFKRSIDDGFRAFTRANGDWIESLFLPLRDLLGFSETLMTRSPWPVVTGVILLIAWFASRSIKVVALTLAILLAVGLLDMWEDTMRTMSIVFVATVISVALGVPMGILMSASHRVERMINPVLDVMQTMPTFVYLIPIVMLLGIGKVPGLVAVVIYAVPPVIRLTNHGIRLVDRDVLEAAEAFGSSRWQTLSKVQLPLALPTIMAGVNQTIMMALGMVVVAAMIGAPGLGQPVLKAIANQYFTLGVFNGLAIVGIAILFDRISQAFGRRLQKHRAPVHE